MDSISFSLPDPDPEGKTFEEKTEKCKEIINTVIVILFLKVKLDQLHGF